MSFHMADSRITARDARRSYRAPANHSSRAKDSFLSTPDFTTSSPAVAIKLFLYSNDIGIEPLRCKSLVNPYRNSSNRSSSCPRSCGVPGNVPEGARRTGWRRGIFVFLGVAYAEHMWRFAKEDGAKHGSGKLFVLGT